MCRREECEGPNFPPPFLLLFTSFLFFCSFALMSYSQSVTGGAFLFLMKGSHTCGLPFTHTLAHDTTVLALEHIDSPPRKHEVIATHTVTHTLVEPLGGSPLTAIQSQSLLAENG